jgi:hypothetical protein
MAEPQLSIFYQFEPGGAGPAAGEALKDYL